MILKILSVIVISAAAALPAQSPSNEWQSALILDVKEHQGNIPDQGADPSITRYDVSMRVKDTEYVLLYTPRPGTYGFQYVKGMNILVLVKNKTVTFNDILGRPVTVPIVSQKPVAPNSKH